VYCNITPFLLLKSPASTIYVIVKSMVIFSVLVKEGILFLCNTEISSITICFPVRKGAVKLRIFPVDRKDCFTIKLLAEDQEVAWCVSMTDAAVILGAMLVMMTSSMANMANKIVVRISGDYNDMGCCGWHGGCRTFTIAGGMFGRGRSGCADLHQTGLVHG